MPVHDLGYRAWPGRRISDLFRWWVIAHTGIRLAWRKAYLRRMLLFAWGPVVFGAIAFFAFEQTVEQSPGSLQFFVGFLDSFDGRGEFRDVIRDVRVDPHAARHRVWTTLMMILFRQPQAILMVMIVGLTAPALIANDMRSRAFLLYFSRPITPWEYVLGKSVVVWTFILLITLLPAMLLYVLAVLLSPDLSVIWSTWDLPLRIVLASAVLVIPTTALALCFSAMTRESRYATFGWFALWILGWVSYSILTTIDAANSSTRDPASAFSSSRWTLLSPFHTLGEVQSFVFGLRGSFADVLPEAMVLLTVTVFSLAIMLRRVTAPIRV